MQAADVPIVGASFWAENDQDFYSAAIALVVALVIAKLVDTAFARRGRAIAGVVAGGDLTPVIDTRLRFLRRLAFATIVVIGVAVALSNFARLDRLAASVLASGAIAAAVIGFAARQTLANLVAGAMLAITQPIRIGDTVCFEGETGTVEDVRLTYTYLRTGDGHRVIIPNERLAAGTIRNDTIIDPEVAVEIEVWLPLEADLDAAVHALAREPDTEARIAEIAKDGVRLLVTGESVHASERLGREATLRADTLRRLRAAGVIPVPAAQG